MICLLANVENLPPPQFTFCIGNILSLPDMKYLLSEVTKQRRRQEATELEEMVLEQITLFLGGHATIVVAIIGIVANSLAVAVFCRSSLLLINSDITAYNT